MPVSVPVFDCNAKMPILPPAPTAPSKVAVPVPEIRVKFSSTPPAVPLVEPVMLISPAEPAPVFNMIVCASSKITVSLIVISCPDVTILSLNVVVAPEPSKVTEASPAPVIWPSTVILPPAGVRTVIGSLKVIASIVTACWPSDRPIVIPDVPSFIAAISASSN